MPDIQAQLASIEDEDVLHKMLTDTEVFEDRRHIRARLREIRENRSGGGTSNGGGENKTNGKMSDVPEASESSEEAVFRSTKTEKGPSGESTTTTTTTTKQTSTDGTTKVVKQTKQVTQVGGLGGTNVVVTKTSAAKTSSRGALAAFKEMDSTNNPGPRPNIGGLSPTSPTGPGGKVMVQRSPSTIKEMLLTWAKRCTEEYDNVNITNFSSSWNDGMAFCALVHHFYPRAFDYSKLKPQCRRGNFKLAFDVADKLGDCAPLLDVEDMVRMKNPDWKCVFTYVQSLYRHFRDKDENAQKKEEKKEEAEG